MSRIIKEIDLTKRQEAILKFIKAHKDESGYPPTIAEIQEKFSFKSPNAVQDHIRALERKGRIRKIPNQWRGLEVVDSHKNIYENNKSATVSVPLVGHVAAGSPVLAEENIEGIISVDRSLVSRTTKLFALRVYGESMIKAAICDGDIVIAHQQPTADNGDIIIALIGDEATVKRFFRKGDTVILKPENDKMHPIKVSQGKEFCILGKVIATLRRIVN